MCQSRSISAYRGNCELVTRNTTQPGKAIICLGNCGGSFSCRLRTAEIGKGKRHLGKGNIFIEIPHHLKDVETKARSYSTYCIEMSKCFERSTVARHSPQNKTLPNLLHTTNMERRKPPTPLQRSKARILPAPHRLWA